MSSEKVSNLSTFTPRLLVMVLLVAVVVVCSFVLMAMTQSLCDTWSYSLLILIFAQTFLLRRQAVAQHPPRSWPDVDHPAPRGAALGDETVAAVES